MDSHRRLCIFPERMNDQASEVVDAEQFKEYERIAVIGFGW
jgi:hypothetical protein